MRAGFPPAAGWGDASRGEPKGDWRYNSRLAASEIPKLPSLQVSSEKADFGILDLDIYLLNTFNGFTIP